MATCEAGLCCEYHLDKLKEDGNEKRATATMKKVIQFNEKMMVKPRLCWSADFPHISSVNRLENRSYSEEVIKLLAICLHSNWWRCALNCTTWTLRTKAQGPEFLWDLIEKTLEYDGIMQSVHLSPIL